MSNHKQSPSKEKRRKITTVMPLLGGLVILLLILALGGWYLFNSGRQSSPTVVAAVTTGSSANESIESEAEEQPIQIPEGVPEEDAPGTPVPSFVDDFEDGLDPVWTVHYGDPFITDGQLTSNVGAGIAAGDASWENYQVDFDVDATQTDCTFVDTSNSVGVRVTDFDHAYWFVFTNCNAGWSLFAGGINQGVLSLLPDTQVDTSKDAKHITIKVNETEMSAYENGSLLSSITDSRFHTGGIFLQIEAQTLYDNFKVTLLP